MKVGDLSIKNNLFLAPMAGVTDRPFRMLCKKLGAGVAVSEMVTSNSLLYGSEKTIQRANHEGEVDPISVQIAGADPKMMGDAARYNQDRGAQIIDINMGCPAKKICNVMAGSALLKHEKLVEEILNSVVSSVTIPVTLKIRTGWDRENKNAIKIAKIAENSGIKALAIHGRTRACLYHGHAEYDTIAEVKQNIKIPVIANGDITTPQKAKFVLNYTKADGIMIGRAAQGRPWIFREIDFYLKNNKELELPTIQEIQDTTIEHVNDLYNFYGELKGVRIARKHISWYTKGLKNSAQFRFNMNQIEDVRKQQTAINDYFEQLKVSGKFIPYDTESKEPLVA
ncbi:MAG: tRNA dihydrouridine synthase DusB [Methylophilaceae bacterium]|nr:tRNA dihydrouridine synthase DusB [Methylophilaceae bacterium]MBL6726964.1 tRNA dihydrouridine synthase DusB [Methylophilaceae bacterium]MBL6728663.1 tRNA dihydrouridine synthase DusB [Methylophilaceae bacterium]MBL6791449.1 tRNA dihydrouridine synthase DusB [Methylophilaceae bacterium]